MSSQTLDRIAVLVVALAVGIACLLALQPRADAQQLPLPNPDDVLDAKETFRLKEYLKNAKPSDFTTPTRSTPVTAAEAAAKTDALTKASRAKWLAAGSRAGIVSILGSAAAGIWVHNATTLYTGLTGPGEPEAIYLDAQYRQAEKFLESSGGTGGGFAKYYNASGVMTGSVVVTNASYTYDPVAKNCTAKLTFVAKSSSTTTSKWGGTVGHLRTGTNTANSCTTGFLAGAPGGSGNLSPYSYTNSASLSSPLVVTQFYTADSGGPNNGVKRFFGESITAGNNYEWTNPVWDFGEPAVLDLPGSGEQITSTPDETNNLFKDIKAQTCTPDAPPTEVCPDYFPEEWEEEFPKDPNADPATEPYADPDRDGNPNHSDPDDDNDGIPDTEDPELTPLPITDPNADPDGDQIPNKDDPDDDNDGLPDADDPDPVTPTDPTTLPANHPYADPDGDQIPNKDDPDDDNDGDPDTTDPAPHDPAVESPDTDGDGIPDRDDPDDDNDGTPDTEDPAPTDPNDNGDFDRDLIPDQSDGDEDGDGIPDWEDVGERDKSSPVAPGAPAPDLDGDGVPDWSDPWPGNQYAPADPSLDGDLDGVPDYKDPMIGDPISPMKPWAPGSPGDKPGNPGQPNIPPNPENPNYPTSPNMPAQPSDPTSPINPTTPINPNQPMPPGEPGGPPSTTTEPPPTEAAQCAIVAPKPVFRPPGPGAATLFPFNIFILAVDAIATLDAPPTTPVLPEFMPGVATDLHFFDPIAYLARTCLMVLGLIGACFLLYRIWSSNNEGTT